jgi:hypothetical protein
VLCLRPSNAYRKFIYHCFDKESVNFNNPNIVNMLFLVHIVQLRKNRIYYNKYLFFVWFYCASTRFWSCGAETGMMILVNLGRYKLKATPAVKTTSPAGAKRCLDLNPFSCIVRSLRDGCCYFDSSGLKGQIYVTLCVF